MILLYYYFIFIYIYDIKATFLWHFCMPRNQNPLQWSYLDNSGMFTSLQKDSLTSSAQGCNAPPTHIVLPENSDVYSFGAVLLGILTWKRACGESSILLHIYEMSLHQQNAVSTHHAICRHMEEYQTSIMPWRYWSHGSFKPTENITYLSIIT